MFGNIFNKFDEAQTTALKTIQESQEFLKTSRRSLEGGEMDGKTAEEVKASVKQAGVDYPMHLIDNDGFQTFVWNEVVITLSKDTSKEVIEKIKASSFEMFKANADIQKQSIKDTLKKAVEQEVTKAISDSLDKLVEQEIIPPTVTESLQDDLKEAVASIEQPKTVEQTAMAAAIHKAIGEDTLKAAAAEDRIYEDKTFKFNRVKRRR